MSLTSQVPTLKALHALNPLQQPAYSSPHYVAEVVGKLRTLPPLVFAAECDKLRGKMANVAAGEAFMLQGGDCAETFADVTAGEHPGQASDLAFHGGGADLRSPGADREGRPDGRPVRQAAELGHGDSRWRHVAGIPGRCG